MEVLEITQLPKLTVRQSDVLNYLYTYLREHRYMPTRREVAKYLELKSDNSTPYLQALEKKGYIGRGGHTKRNLQLTSLAYEKLKFDGIHN